LPKLSQFLTLNNRTNAQYGKVGQCSQHSINHDALTETRNWSFVSWLYAHKHLKSCVPNNIIYAARAAWDDKYIQSFSVNTWREETTGGRQQ